MITMNTEKQLLSYPEAKAKYDGHWLLFDQRDYPPEEDMGYVVAYGDGTAEDREALCDMNHSKYNGRVLLMKGWASKNDIYYCSIIEEV
jgi:hypothetical protein